MASIVDIAGAGAGFVVHQGLMGTPAQWCLPLGVAKAAPVRAAARFLIAAVAVVLLAWVGALVLDAHTGHTSWWQAMSVGMVGVLWLGMAWHLWRGLARAGTVTLVWGGLPPHRPSTDHTAQRDAPMTLPGWSVQEWRQAVSVHVVFDLGAWVLLKVLSKEASPGQVVAWSWLNAQAAFRGDAGHHWRALLFNRHANDVGDVRGGRADVMSVMASFGHTQRRWPNLLSSFKNTGRGSGASHTTILDDGFAATQILVPSRPVEHADIPDRGPQTEARS
jgi:hypothetical protein